MASARRARLSGPPDGGWGWMIVAGCFLVTICTRAVTRCISIFFVEFQAYFGQDYARTAWIHSIVDCATMLCGWLVDTTGSYTASFLLCGFSMIFSSALLCFARLAKKIKRTGLRSLTGNMALKQHIWTNGAIAYSVTAELDQRDVEVLAVDTNSYSNSPDGHKH